MNSARCPGQDPRFLRPQDVAEVQCPNCGRPVEFWPDEPVRKCRGCGHRFVNPKNAMTCLQWCRYAAQCLAATRGESGALVAPLREELIERMKKAFGENTARIEHALAVLSLAEHIAQLEGGDSLIVAAASILHDIGYCAGEEDHGQQGRARAADILSDLALPRAVEQEILDIIERHHDRGRINTPSGAAVFDADLIVNLRESTGPERDAVLSRQALTATGRNIGTARFAHNHTRTECQ